MAVLISRYVPVYEQIMCYIHERLNRDFCKLRCLVSIQIIESDIAFEGAL